LPLNRPSETYAREWIELDSSTIAYWVGACTATLSSLVRRIQAHVLAAGRLPGDDTTMPLMAKGETATGRLLIYVRDDRPYAGPPPLRRCFLLARPGRRAPALTFGSERRHPTG